MGRDLTLWVVHKNRIGSREPAVWDVCVRTIRPASCSCCDSFDDDNLLNAEWIKNGVDDEYALGEGGLRYVRPSALRTLNLDCPNPFNRPVIEAMSRLDDDEWVIVYHWS
jgi:hypothetical protein